LEQAEGGNIFTPQNHNIFSTMKNIIQNSKKSDNSWQKIVMQYTTPVLSDSIWQLVNTFVPYVILWYLMYRSLEFPYWITLLLAVLASGFLIRLFIIFHDCGHGSFFRSKKANSVIGKITGILSFTPYNIWHDQHAIHHATAGNLDKRGVGDVFTMTADEYRKASKWDRLIYRVFRNPFIMFTIGPIVVIFIKNRFTRKRMSAAEKSNIYFTNVVSAMLVAGLILLMGLKSFLLIQIPVILISHSVGIWLFYIQHQFDDVEWERGEVWDYKTAALKGCSFLKLPPVLQWFTGNIGYHHVHHLSSRIPNYKLEACHNENEMFKNVKPIKFSSTIRALSLHLWDEDQQRLISFKEMKMARELVAG
jgi:acyl-lipid omega-6 desaturase (Delta-12 desaturase)